MTGHEESGHRIAVLLARLDVLITAMRETLDELYDHGVSKPPCYRPTLTLLEDEG